MPSGPMRSLTVISALVCIVFIYLLLWNLLNGASDMNSATHSTHGHTGDPKPEQHGSSGQAPDHAPESAVPPAPAQSTKTPQSGPAYGTGPAGSSWSSWFSPQSWWSTEPATHGGTIDEDWNILYHLGGDGPWVQNENEVIKGEGVGPPDGCKVEQVHMLSRHAERWPTTAKGQRRFRPSTGSVLTIDRDEASR
jgi:hypothetical protein